MPLISILLPTRNRLALAKDAIETVRRQPYANWELVVADNHSDDDYAAHVRSLQDDRIVFTRSKKFISVTQNWNEALKTSKGDYIVMLGDDDGLTPNYSQRVLKVIENFDKPDFIYHGAYQFLYPNTLNEHLQSKLTDVTRYSKILNGLKAPSLLPRKEAVQAARHALNMKVVYAFNMQHFLFSRDFITRLEEFGPMFQGPFPDFYAANMAMLLGKNVVVVPEPLTIIGISPKSYGQFHFNRREKEGIEFLNADSIYPGTVEAVRRNLLPGTNMNSSWLATVAIVKEYMDSAFPNLNLGIGRYRLFQMHVALQADFRDEYDGSRLRTLAPYLRTYELVLLKTVYSLLRLVGPMRRIMLRVFDRIMLYLQYNPLLRKPFDVVGQHRSLHDAFEFLSGAEKNRRGNNDNENFPADV